MYFQRVWEWSHDSTILSNNELGRELETGINDDGFLLGDSGYPCKPWLMTPLPETSSRAEEKYNSSHCRTRNTVERAFGLLKSRFRCLHKSTGCLPFSPTRCSHVIMAAFKLHNFCLDLKLPNPPEVDADTFQVDQDACQDQQEGRQIRRQLIEQYFST
ncbi:putative nuclease HARBI1 [Gigantopelta aegis]|uniref:putative nuclease HARBI1 n=1 Tax=Gigantopelta aegis TaxID=1735272 RepID=UPI001B888746|nr:putative nuclease HARBI1 [Gigantopelta aegis]